MRELSHLQAQRILQSGSPLPAEDKANLAAHLAACAECRAYNEFHTRLAGELPRSYPARRHSEREIRQKISAAQAQLAQRGLPWQMLRYAQSAVAMTAVLALVVGLGYLAFRSLPESSRLHADQPQTTAASEAAAPQPAVAILQTEPAAAGAGAMQDSGPEMSGPPAGTPSGIPAALLAEFPLHKGAAWRYLEESYSQAEGTPTTILRASKMIEERVVAVEDHLAQAILVHIQGTKSMVSADEGWQENGEFPLGDYEYWYVVRNQQVFRSLTKPDAALSNIDQMRLEYQFPLTEGVEWCRTTQRRGTIEQPTPDPQSPCESKVIVSARVSAHTPHGEITGCAEIHDVANSGDLITTFCPGIGVVEVFYAHHGTQFGMTRKLIEFSKNGAFILPSPQPPPAPIPSADFYAQLRSEVMGVALHGHTAYIGAGPYLEAVDLTQPANPQRLARSPLLSDPVSKVIRIPDETTPMMLAAYGRRIATFDISDPEVIDPLGEFILPGKVNSLLLDLNTLQAFAAGPLEGQPSDSYLAIVNLRNPAAPQMVDQTTIEGTLTGIALNSMAGEQPASTEKHLYIGSPDGVQVVSIENNRFTVPSKQGITAPVYSMTFVRGQLVIGSNGSILAYSTQDGINYLWTIDEAAPGVPLGLVYGFELRANAIYAAGYYPDGSRPPFRTVLTPPEPNQTGSVVDTASYISVGNGLMLVSGDREGGGLEIYDILDPHTFRRVGTYQPAE